MATQVSLNSGAVASAGALAIQTNGTTEAVSISTGQVATLAKDAVIQGVTVGRGAGAVATNTAVGSNALAANSTGAEVTAIGRNALAANTVSYSTAVGANALTANTTGAANAAFGAYSLATNTTGAGNSAFGALGFGLSDSALQANTTGSYNSAFGLGALAKNTTASNNTAVGYQAGYTNQTGARNTFFGEGAGYLTTSSFNAFIGNHAGYNTTGGSNTFVGDYAGYLITSGAKNTIIGKFDGNSGGLDIRTASNYIVLSDGDGNPRGYFTNAGAFHVPTMSVGGTANLHWSSSAGQFFVTSSSRRFKHDIVEYDKGLAELMQMQPKYFVYNDEPNQKQRAGFIAEDFHDLGMTEYVEYWKDDEGNDTPSEIGYSNMVAILVKSIQELKAEVDSLKAQINGASA